jgi:uncharacterized integral membrane protein
MFPTPLIRPPAVRFILDARINLTAVRLKHLLWQKRLPIILWLAGSAKAEALGMSNEK